MALRLPSLYVINLDSAKDRLDHFSAFHGQDAECIVRVRAVSGSDVSAAEATRLAEKRRCFFFHGRALTRAELGCCLSHVKAMEMFLATGDEVAVIVEDDITVDLPRLSRLMGHIGKLPQDWEVLKLSYMRRLAPVRIASLMPGFDIVAFFNAATSNGAYLINRSGAQRLTAALTSFTGPIDHCFDRTWETGVCLYGVTPPIAFHRDEVKSDIDNPARSGDAPRNHTSLSWRLWSVTLRPISLGYYARRKYLHVMSYCARPPSLFHRLRRWGVPV